MGLSTFWMRYCQPAASDAAITGKGAPAMGRPKLPVATTTDRSRHERGYDLRAERVCRTKAFPDNGLSRQAQSAAIGRAFCSSVCLKRLSFLGDEHDEYSENNAGSSGGRLGRSGIRRDLRASTISVLPASQTIGVGGTATVDIVVSGLPSRRWAPSRSFCPSTTP